MTVRWAVGTQDPSLTTTRPSGRALGTQDPSLTPARPSGRALVTCPLCLPSSGWHLLSACPGATWGFVGALAPSRGRVRVSDPAVLPGPTPP